MGGFANVLAQGPQPTTAWKSPLDLQQQESTVAHNRASSKAIEQQATLQAQEAQHAEKLRQATIKAAKDAAGDPEKFVSIYLEQTGDKEGADKYRQAFDQHHAAVMTADDKTRAARVAANSRTASALETVLSKKDPVEQARARSMANAQLAQEGLPPLPDAPIEDLGTLRDLVGIEGGIMSRATARAEEERKAATEARAAEEEARRAALAPSQLQISQNTATTGTPNAAGLIPQQQQQADQAKITAERAERTAEIAAQRVAETERHNRETEERMGRLAAAAIAAKDTGTGKPLTQAAINTLEKHRGAVDTTTRLVDNFKDAYAGNTLTGGVENTLGRLGWEHDEGQTQWWQDYQAHKNDVRHGTFGAALTPNETAEWNKQDINERMDPGQIRTNLKRQQEIEQAALARIARVYETGGFSKEQLSEYGLKATPINPAAAAVLVFNPATGKVEPKK